MRCPFCDEDVSSAAALCSSCREVLPSPNLFEFYRIEISKDRSLVLKENRAALDLRAQEQFDTRSRLLKEARERQFQAEENKRQLDRENALIEKNLREAEELLNRQVRQRRLRWAAKFIVLPTILVMICVSSWFVYRHLTENSSLTRATAAHNRAVISRCPVGPTLTILEQTYKNISDSQILDKNQMRDLNAARSRLLTFLSGKPSDPANMALSALYFRLGMVHEGYRISPSLMQEIRVNLDSALSNLDPKSCGDAGIPFHEGSKKQTEVSAGIAQATKTLPTTKSGISAKKAHSKPANSASPKVQKWFFPTIVYWSSEYLGTSGVGVNSWEKYTLCVTVNHYYTFQHAGLIESSGTWGDRSALVFTKPSENVRGDFVGFTNDNDETGTSCGLFGVYNRDPGPYSVALFMEGDYPEWGNKPEIGTVTFDRGRSSAG